MTTQILPSRESIHSDSVPTCAVSTKKPGWHVRIWLFPLDHDVVKGKSEPKAKQALRELCFYPYHLVRYARVRCQGLNLRRETMLKCALVRAPHE